LLRRGRGDRVALREYTGMEPMTTMGFPALDAPRLIEHGAIRIAGVQEGCRQVCRFELWLPLQA